MRLRRVRIQGFKTFADKTEIDLEGGLIAIVGPNGCGKSNIVDAVLWGLGETSAKAVRASVGKEVVFAGSVMRKALGFAEVTVTFDNEDGTLPLDSPEVSVTRRVTRDGDSAYQINRRSCRLKDVADLLADTGLGRAGYSIVSQTEIDQALAASAQQRRAWIDEAAGVQRYRARRNEAIRRLETSKGHLARVKDVLVELEAQREPLREEAEVAQRYKEIQSAIREVEQALLSKEVAGMTCDITQCEETARSATARAVAENALAATSAERTNQLESDISALDTTSEQLRVELRRLDANVEATLGNVRVLEAKATSLDDLEASLNEDRDTADQRLAEAKGDLLAAEDNLEESRMALQSMQKETAGQSAEETAVKADLDRADNELKAARERAAAFSRHQAEAEHRAARISDLAEEIAGIETTLPDLVTAKVDAEAALHAAAKVVAGSEEALAAIEAEIKSVQAQRDELANKHRSALASLAHLDGRRRGLEATLDAHEGLAQGARAVLQAAKDGRLRPEYRPVADCVTASPDVALAIDTALGASANDLVCPDEDSAKRAIELLKVDRLGRATFQPLTLVLERSRDGSEASHAKTKGVLGYASELVTYDRAHEPVVRSLLGRVLVVETLDVALALGRSRGWTRIVTLDGETVYASGAVAGGRTSRQTSGIVQRRSELEETKREEAQARKEIAAFAEKDAALVHKAEGLRTQQTKTSGQLAGDKKSVDEAGEWLKSISSEEGATMREKNRLVSELDRLRGTVETVAEPVDLEPLEEARSALMARLLKLTEDAAGAGAKTREAERKVSEASTHLAAMRKRLEAVEESTKSRAERIVRIRPERESLANEIDVQRKNLEGLTAARDAQEAEVQKLVQTRQETAQKILEQRQVTEECRSKAAESEKQAVEAEIKRTRLEARRSATMERLLEVYGTNLDEALTIAETVEVPKDAALLVPKLRRELREMGDVNVGAVEAYNRLTERFDELDRQSQDVLAGIAEIEKTVADLDGLTRAKFQSTFKEVQEAFNETFSTLFGGGEGALLLVEGADELDSGIEIQVTVPGKKRQRLDLLSGGERAMSALAFLFSLLKVKPSPLVVLDEVDAPLDGRNVERFVDLLRSFEAETQFIVVSHNPSTIASADVWFGVTMQEPGVSSVVRMSVPKEAPEPAQRAYIK